MISQKPNNNKAFKETLLSNALKLDLKKKKGKQDSYRNSGMNENVTLATKYKKQNMKFS